MGEPYRYEVEITPAFLDVAEPRLHAALLFRLDQVLPARRERLKPFAAALRVAGLAVAALGIGLCGYAIVLKPDEPCNQRLLLTYHLFMAAFVCAATFFWFLPRITAGLAAWVRGRTGRRARTLLGPLRRRAPCTVAYAVAAGRVEARAERLRLVRATDLRRVGAAVVTPALACLYRGRRSLWLRRVVFFAGEGAREALVGALRAAGSEVSLVDGPPRP